MRALPNSLVTPLVIATHNLMNGLRLPALIRHHRRLRDDVGLDVLCIQENATSRRGAHVDRIATALGPQYSQVSDVTKCRLGIIYDRHRMQCDSVDLIPLPRLDKLRLIERTYIVEGSTQQKYAQIARFTTANSAPITVANFHLDTAGSNQHRAKQLAHIANALATESLAAQFVACGDTNTFALPRRRQQVILRDMLQPLTKLGGRDTGHDPTHHFSRQGEATVAHRLAALAARFLFDLPLRYDVLCTNVNSERAGTHVTVESDHDLVWAKLQLSAPCQP